MLRMHSWRGYFQVRLEEGGDFMRGKGKESLGMPLAMPGVCPGAMVRSGQGKEEGKEKRKRPANRPEWKVK